MATAKHLVLHFQLLPEEYERFEVRARREHKSLQKVLEEEVWVIRQQLDPTFDDHLLWQVSPDTLYLTITTVPGMGVREDEDHAS